MNQYVQPLTDTPTAWTGHRVLRLAVLALGPVVTLASARLLGAHYRADEVAAVETVVLALWSPLFFSFPALLLQHDRDRALPAERNSLVRGLKLIPHLLSPTSSIRVETAVSVAAFLWLATVTGPSALTVLGRFLG